MIKMLKNILVLLLLVSCSTETLQSTRSLAAVGMEEDFSWVEQLNFDKKPEEKYKADKDVFSFPPISESNHVLIKESLSTLPAAKLEEASTATNDPITKINIKCQQGKFDEAFKIADEEYSRFKNNTSYWNQLGTCFYLKSDNAKAILFYNKSRDLDAKFVPPVNNLGVVYQKQGKHQKALSAFKLASDLNSFTVTPTYNLAQIYLRFSMVSKALPIFQGLHKKSPNDAEVTAALASAYLIKGDYSEAIDLYAKLDKGLLSRPGIGLNYAVALKLANRPVDAKSALDNVTSASTEERMLKEYFAKVEKLIRN